MIDLNSLIDPGLGITLFDATAINDKGDVVVNGYDAGLAGDRAFLLTPAPEPGTLVLCGVALCGLALRMRSRRIASSVTNRC